MGKLLTIEKDRSRNFGKISISENPGFIVGPALSRLLSMTGINLYKTNIEISPTTIDNKTNS